MRILHDVHNELCERANDTRVRPDFSIKIISQNLDAIKRKRDFVKKER